MKTARVFRCPAAARWLPRVLSGTLLAAAAWVLLSMPHEAAFAGLVKAMLIGTAGAGALWILRGGRDLEVTVGVIEDRLQFSRGRHRIETTLGELESVDYAGAFSNLSHWPPALLLVDRHGRGWRVPAMIDEAAELVEIVTGGDRSELRSWASARRVVTRMARSRYLIVAGYLGAALILFGARRLI